MKHIENRRKPFFNVNSGFRYSILGCSLVVFNKSDKILFPFKLAVDKRNMESEQKPYFNVKRKWPFESID